MSQIAKMRGEKYIGKKNILALSVLLLQEKILTEKSGSREYRLCSIKSNPSKEKQAASGKDAEGWPESEGMLRGKFMLRPHEQNVSVSSNLDIPPPVP